MAISRRSSSRCFDPYRGYTTDVVAVYACTVIFTAVYLGILVALCITRRKTGPGKHLIGWPYTLALIFAFLNQACSFLSTTLVACEATNDRTSFYDWNVANSVFYGVTTFLLLFVVIYTLNTMLRKHLGHSPSALKVVAGLALFVLGGLLVPYIVIQCYLSWQYRDISKTPDIKIDVFATRYISLAFDGMFLVCVLGFGALSIRTARSIKKKYGTSNSLTIRISVLVISLVGLNMVSIIYTAGMMSYHIFFTSASYVVIFYLLSIFPAIAFVSIIVIAKDPAWKFNNHEPTTIQSQQFAYYQQDPPVHGGVRSV